MNRSTKLVVATATTAAAMLATAQPLDTDALARRLDGAIDKAIAEKRIVGTVVLVARGRDVIYHRAAGMADRRSAEPMAEDSIFLLSSVTKAVVTMAAMRLVDQGVLKLEDPVTKWLPDFRPKTADGSTPVITVRHLLTHTAGLSYDFVQPEGGPYREAHVSNGFDEAGITLDENLRRAASVPLAYEPGSSWGYSIAHDVLGAVIAKATGASLPDTVRALVTAPLGMDDAAFSVVDRSRLVTHYADSGQGAEPIADGQSVPFNGKGVRFSPSRIFASNAFASGGAGMAGSAPDVLKLLQAIEAGGGALVKPSTLAAAMQAQVGPQASTQGPGWGFGYGWAVLVDPAATRSPFSAGTIKWGGVYGHGWFVDPVRHLSVVVLTNTTFEGMAGKFPVELRDAIYGR